MSEIALYTAPKHRNVLLPVFDAGAGIPCNQHLIVHGGSAMLLDPGGKKLYQDVFAACNRALRGARLTAVFCSHQDPDVVAALNGWLMVTDATGYISELWRRFIPHFGSDRLVYDRITPLPDGPTTLDLDGCALLVLPAHFLHACGNHHVYDPVAKILYTGDLCASVGTDDRVIEAGELDAHLTRMEGFHRRYMSSSAALRAWVAMVRGLDIEMLAPQHGAVLRGRDTVARVLDWLDALPCGIDVLREVFTLPAPSKDP